jgi:hypothetical protein
MTPYNVWETSKHIPCFRGQAAARSSFCVMDRKKELDGPSVNIQIRPLVLRSLYSSDRMVEPAYRHAKAPDIDAVSTTQLDPRCKKNPGCEEPPPRKPKNSV